MNFNNLPHGDMPGDKIRSLYFHLKWSVNERLGTHRVSRMHFGLS